MRQGSRGFSLIEAMLSTLVLSVGLLGLARLQAQLWAAAGQLHISAAAYRISADTMERLRTSIHNGEPLLANRSFQSAAAGALLHTRVEITHKGQRIDASLHTQWEDTKGRHSIALRTLRDIPAQATDSRWLLPGK